MLCKGKKTLESITKRGVNKCAGRGASSRKTGTTKGEKGPVLKGG